MTDAGRTSDFPLGTGVIQIATSLVFTQDSPTYTYSGGPVPQGLGAISIKQGTVHIALWPTNVFDLPAKIEKTLEGIVVEFSHKLHSDGPTIFKAFYASV